MKSWMLVPGLVAACAACCALPVAGLLAGLPVLGGLAAFCIDDLPLRRLLLAGAPALAALAAFAAWRMRARARARRQVAAQAGTAPACACAAACDTGEACHART
jgi:hypothetical protein